MTPAAIALRAGAVETPDSVSDERSYELSDAERRDLVTRLEQGRVLPEKYRDVLFEARREVELVWPGKTREPCSPAVPFRTLERIEPPPPPPQPDAPLAASADPPPDGWVNQLFRGDNQLVLASLRSGDLRRRIEAAGGIKLIYVDPPFDVGQDFHMDVEIGEPAFSERPSRVRLPAYRDTWGTGKDSFLAMLWERLLLMHELLCDDGSIYVHCDWRVSAQVRLVLDEIFGRNHFSNEIVWHYYNKLQGNVGRFASNHDVILSYRKGQRFHFEPLREKRDEPKRQQKRAWDPQTRSLKQARDEQGNLLYYEETERTIDDVWRLPYLMPANQKEPLGYPTQKPEQLVERIVRSSSRPGDLIADFFCGSGTTPAVAERLGRKWIASDSGGLAVQTTRKRLIGLQRERASAGDAGRAFELSCPVDVEGGGPADERVVTAKAQRDAPPSRALRIELTDFRLRCGSSDAVVVGTMHGRSPVTCEQGQLRVLTPRAGGGTDRKLLTRHWTDWVDCWAVDFDFERRADADAAVFRPAWHGLRTRRQRRLELVTARHAYERPGRYAVAVRVVDVLGRETMTVLRVEVG